MKIPSWLQSWAGLIAVLSLALGVIGTLALATEMGHPFGGYLSYSVAADPIGHVAVGTPSWWPIYEIDPEFGGDLLTVDGQPYTPAVRAVFGATLTGEPVVITYVAPEDGQPRSLSVPAELFSLGYFLEIKLPDLIVALAFGLLGIVVLRAGPEGETNRVFAALTTLIFAHRMLNVHTLFIDNTFVPTVLEASLRFVSALIAAAAFHFAWLYPTPLPKRPVWLIRLYYAAAILVAIPLVIARIPWRSADLAVLNRDLNTIAFQLLLYLYLVGFAAIVVRLIFSAIHHNRTRREKRILQVTVFGVLMALPFMIMLAAEIIPGLEPTFYFDFLDLRILFIAIPFAFALAIIRYQNMMAPSAVFVFVAILAGSALLANIAAWLWQVAQPETAGSRPPFVPFFFVILAASLFWSMQTTWRGWLGRFLEREQLNYKATRDLGRRLQATADLQELPQTIAEAIAGELELDYTAVWTANRAAGYFELKAQAGESIVPLPTQLPLPERNPGTFPIRTSGAAKVPAWLQPIMDQQGVEIVAPLYRDDDPVALLGFGPRWDEDIFDDRDLVAIELIGQQAQLYLQVARQIEELRQVPHLVSQAQERERTLLASELHDTTQQFLGRLPFFLAAVRETMTEDPQAATELLERSLLDIEEAAVTVQAIRQNLAPSQLDHSLARSLTALVTSYKKRYGLDVLLMIRGDVDTAAALETRLALYRVIQHALDNAVLHAQTDRIQVDLLVEDGIVHFAVSDQGCGVTAEDLDQALSGGHFGIPSMRARIEACGGKFSFQSTAGQGTQVAGWVPALRMPE